MTSSPELIVPTIDDIRAAAERIASHAVRTPLLESPHLNEIVGGRLLVKAEPLQRTGAFKFRGAYNTLVQIPENERKNGVVAFSSGNHAQGVAHAAELLGLPAVIVMPKDAPPLKVENTRGYGAEVVLYDRYTENREEIGARIADERGATLVKPYDDPRIIAGQGTAGLEITEQLDGNLDQVLCPVGGGGLASGVAIAIKAAYPDASVYACEPAGYDSMGRSLAAGAITGNDAGAGATICDALLPKSPGNFTFAIGQDLFAGGLAVTDDQVRSAMAQAFLRLKLVVEPGGAAGLAAALSGVLDCSGKTTVAVCSGGNVDPSLFADVLRDCL
ncbi:MAG: threonine/serine dehydratase [Rhodospirillaceae bacterium]|nr:threonine/serine dehydratase [Rhodospirillaceae bacterium]